MLGSLDALPYIASVRIALISMVERAGDDPVTLRSELAIAGRTVAQRQLDLALSLGCERIACLADGLGRPVIGLQHQAEAAGAKFNIVNGPRQLLGLVASADELVLFSEGLLPSAGDAAEALKQGTGVLVFPVEKGLAAGFERIDLNHAWAGVLSMPGRLVERLSELPPDCDAVSSLMRIALQGRVAERFLPEALLDRGRWMLVDRREQMVELERDWFRRHAAVPSIFAPGRAMARLIVRRTGGGLLARGWRPAWFSGIGALLAAGAVASAWMGYSFPAILACGAAWLLIETGGALYHVAGAGLGSDHKPGRMGAIFSVFVDLCLIAILTLGLYGIWPERAFPPLVLIGLLHVGQRQITVKWAEILQDRAVLAIILALPAALSLLEPAIQLVVLALLGLVLIQSGSATRLTRA